MKPILSVSDGLTVVIESLGMNNRVVLLWGTEYEAIALPFKMPDLRGLRDAIDKYLLVNTGEPMKESVLDEIESIMEAVRDVSFEPAQADLDLILDRLACLIQYRYENDG